jgi:predicted DNA-binding transcriptional regulator AlpA
VTDARNHLTALVAALPADGAATVPVAWLRELLGSIDPKIPDREHSPANIAEPAADQLLTADDMAARFGLGRDSLYRHWKTIPGAVKLGRKVLRFPETGVRSYLDAHRQPKAS